MTDTKQKIESIRRKLEEDVAFDIKVDFRDNVLTALERVGLFTDKIFSVEAGVSDSGWILFEKEAVIESGFSNPEELAKRLQEVSKDSNRWRVQDLGDLMAVRKEV